MIPASCSPNIPPDADDESTTVVDVVKVESSNTTRWCVTSEMIRRPPGSGRTDETLSSRLAADTRITGPNGRTGGTVCAPSLAATIMSARKATDRSLLLIGNPCRSGKLSGKSENDGHARHTGECVPT